MSKKKHKTMKVSFGEILAGEKETPETALREISRNCPVGPSPTSERDPAAAGDLRVSIPSDSNLSFRPLSRYLLFAVYERVQKNIDTFCESAGFTLDGNYWKRIAEQLLTVNTVEDVLIVASRAGYGKSTFIRAFVLAVISLCLEEPDYADELSGMVIVFQKVEDLNALVRFVQKRFDSPGAIVALQGWTPSAKREGYCQNPDVHDYQECHPRNCPYAPNCKVRSFHSMASTAYVVCLTQERFKRYLDTPQMDVILNRLTSSGGSNPRRYLFFDENPNLSRISALTKEKINAVSTEFHKFVQSGFLTDNTAGRWQRALSYGIDSLYQNLRLATLGAPNPDDMWNRETEILAGECQADDRVLDDRERSYHYLRNVLSAPGRICTPITKEIFAVTDRLYSGETCVFCKSNGFAIFDIKPAQYRFENHLTVVFDATAEVDADYKQAQNVRFLPCPSALDMRHVTFHVYEPSVYNVAKSQMNTPWKLPAFAHLIHDILESRKVPTFLCTYKRLAGPLFDALERELPQDLLDLLARMPEKERTLPYLGGTNGSNTFRHCTQMIMLGTPTLNPETYLTHTCAAFGTETVMGELKHYTAQNGEIERPWDLLKLPSIADYANRHTVTRLEQEIYRLAIRNYGNRKPIHIHLFAPAPRVLEMLLKRFQGAKVDRLQTVPSYFTEGKAMARTYQGGKTAFARLAEFLRASPSFPLKVSGIQEQLSISKSTWKELMKDDKVKALLKELNIARSGRGHNAVWTCGKSV